MHSLDETARDILEKRWFTLTRQQLPELALVRDWPVHLDHCFQRILLDNAAGRPWRELVDPPAYRNAPDEMLLEAVALAELVIEGRRDLAELNRKSLSMRGKLQGAKGPAARGTR